MAFKGNVSTEGAVIKKYVGVASVKVRGVNPSKEELDKFYDRESGNAPVYNTIEEVNGNKVQQVRIDFLVETDKYKDADGNPMVFKNKVSFFLRNEPRLSSAGKYQIIDKYGRTAWATQEEIDAHQIPVYSNGKPANIDAGYRKAYSGEEDLIGFLIAYLNIPAPSKYVNGEWVMKTATELADAEASLEHIADYFKGDFKELKSIVTLLPENEVKVLFGLKSTDDGKQYQTPYTRKFLKNSVSDYSRLDKEVMDSQSAGAYPNVVFDCTDLHEFVVVPTQLDEPVAPTKTPWD